MGVVEKFYMVDVLTVYRTYLPKNFKCTFRFAKIILKNLLASFFVDTECNSFTSGQVSLHQSWNNDELPLKAHPDSSNLMSFHLNVKQSECNQNFMKKLSSQSNLTKGCIAAANHSLFAMDLDKFHQYYSELQTVALLVQLFTDVTIHRQTSNPC